MSSSTYDLINLDWFVTGVNKWFSTRSFVGVSGRRWVKHTGILYVGFLLRAEEVSRENGWVYDYLFAKQAQLMGTLCRKGVAYAGEDREDTHRGGISWIKDRKIRTRCCMEHVQLNHTVVAWTLGIVPKGDRLPLHKCFSIDMSHSTLRKLCGIRSHFYSFIFSFRGTIEVNGTGPLSIKFRKL